MGARTCESTSSPSSPSISHRCDKSLPGKAIEAGIVELAVHDLRRWTHDVHQSVDDAPYGGGPGMVMKAPVWGDALDEICSDETLLVVPTPAGEPFTQWVAARLCPVPGIWCSRAVATRASTNGWWTRRAAG